MDSLTIIQSIFQSYEKLPGYADIEYLSYITSKNNEGEVLFEKKAADFTPLKLNVIDLFKDNDKQEPLSGKMRLSEQEKEKAECKEKEETPEAEPGEAKADEVQKQDEPTDEKEDNCESKEATDDAASDKEQADKKDAKAQAEDTEISFYVVKIESEYNYYLAVQSQNEIGQETKALVDFMHDNILSTNNACTLTANEKFKAELGKLREFQARLFPKFDNVKQLDIASVYLPADLMSGNFIDAFFINEKIYQIVICHVEGYDASSAFTAATIRTLIRTNSSVRVVPSALLNFILKKIEKVIAGLHSLISVTLLQINVESGQVKISSLGPPNVLHASPAKKKILLTNTFPTGKVLSRRKDVLDITIHLEPDDMLLYYATGVTKAVNPKTKEQFSVNKLAKVFWDNIADESLFITHSLSDAIYEFTEYSSFEEDIVLLALKNRPKEQ